VDRSSLEDEEDEGEDEDNGKGEETDGSEEEEEEDDQLIILKDNDFIKMQNKCQREGEGEKEVYLSF